MEFFTKGARVSEIRFKYFLRNWLVPKNWKTSDSRNICSMPDVSTGRIIGVFEYLEELWETSFKGFIPSLKMVSIFQKEEKR